MGLVAQEPLPGAAIDAGIRFIRVPLASRWSVGASSALGVLMSRRGLLLLEAGLTLDVILTALEGRSLWRGFTWPRVALATINLAVVRSLAWRINRTRRVMRGRMDGGDLHQG